jgi:NitT/TauT family transport system substrate-binding protein
LQNNLPSFSRDGLMPGEAPNNVVKALTRFDPAIAKTNIDVTATYDNRFVEKALQGTR